MRQKTAKNILWHGECSCLQHCNHLYSWWRIAQTIGIPSRIQKISQWNKCSTYLRNWCPNKMRSMEWNNWLGKFSMVVFVFDWWWTNHQSSTHKGLRLFRFCIVSWKDKREPSIKHSMGAKIGMVQNFSELQKLGQNWRRINGIRVEYFPKIQYVAAQSRSQRVIVEIKRDTREFHRTHHLPVDVQWHHMGKLRQWNGMYC